MNIMKSQFFHGGGFSLFKIPPKIYESDTKLKPAFTLAEVLITLVIIGVIAAISVPVIYNNYQKRVIETRLLKFYSTFNQAIKMAEVKYGDKKRWYSSNSGSTTLYDEDGNAIDGSNAIDNWFQKYLASGFIITKKELNSNGSVKYYLNDGSAFDFLTGNDMRSDDIHFYPGGNKCQNPAKSYGVCVFAFNFKPNSTSSKWKYLYNKGMEPYMFDWDGTRENLINDSSYGCNVTGSGNGLYCTALIQLNGWQIPDDYPFNVRL
ncbi:MAG: type II secretion system GspH family protein [Candidatus Gastranaerophilales bacterium]|nr:type II secretion system GspH family protein [Candidatus Gastranaerophilales bacterium]